MLIKRRGEGWGWGYQFRTIKGNFSRQNPNLNSESAFSYLFVFGPWLKRIALVRVCLFFRHILAQYPGIWYVNVSQQREIRQRVQFIFLTFCEHLGAFIFGQHFLKLACRCFSTKDDDIINDIPGVRQLLLPPCRPNFNLYKAIDIIF